MNNFIFAVTESAGLITFLTFSAVTEEEARNMLSAVGYYYGAHASTELISTTRTPSMPFQVEKA